MKEQRKLERKSKTLVPGQSILFDPMTHLPVMPRTDQGPVRLAANKKEQEFHDALAGTA